MIDQNGKKLLKIVISFYTSIKTDNADLASAIDVNYDSNFARKINNLKY